MPTPKNRCIPKPKPTMRHTLDEIERSLKALHRGQAALRTQIKHLDGELVSGFTGIFTRQSDALVLLQAHQGVLEGILATQERILGYVTPPPEPDATGFVLTPYTQPITGGSTPNSEGVPPMVDPGTLTPLPPGTRIPANSNIVLKVATDPPGTKVSGLGATSDNSPAPTTEQIDPKNFYVICPPPADLTLDSVITIGDPDGSPSASFTIDWDNSLVVDDATGLTLNAFTQPIV